ncbi:MAG: transglutaminase-like domain-containing protein [Promethearchaeota archaeon]
MSELREEILGGGINKKRIIGTILVVIILISIFAFSTVFFSVLFGSQRPFPSEELKDHPTEDALLIKPPFPFDEDFWQDLLDQVDDPQSLLDMLSDMFDGDIDDLDLNDFSDALRDLLFTQAGEIEVFRVYDYLDFSNMTNVLWKMECFDEYTGDGWTSNAGSDLYNFYSYGEYLSQYSPDPELLTIKMPLSPNMGSNTMTIPTLFPIPFVIDGSIYAPNLDLASPKFYKGEYNCTTLDLSFNAADDVNMTFDMFGLYNHLPSAEELNSSAVEAVWTPAYIKDKYLQLPPSIELYKTNNDDFTTHYNVLDGIINPSDNAFFAASKIRNYLQSQFSFPMTADDYNPAPEGTDIVEWFCETGQGIWSDFASAFCAFSRAFGIASRFVDGFQSYTIEEFYDVDEGKNAFAIKYENLFSWAEIYVPTDVSGNGKWVQFNVFDAYGGGGNPVIGGNYNITVTLDQLSYIRPDVAIINATINSSSDPVEGLTLTFTDTTTGQEIGQSVTDFAGRASVSFNVDSSQIVGPHLIEARYDLFTAGYNLTTILGDISIALTNVNPGAINISDTLPDVTNIVGFVYDPLLGPISGRVEGPEINIRLFQKGTSNEVFNAFSPSSINTSTNGDFDDFLNLIYASAGNYEVRADLNGTWWIDTPLGSYDYFILSIGFGAYYFPFTNSSNRIDFNITKALDVWFYIDGFSSNNPTSPTVSRYHDLNLTAQVLSLGTGPIPNKIVNFYDYSRGNVWIGSDISNSNGIASILYTVDDYCRAGPNLLYAMVGLQPNYSYFVLNEAPTINIISGPTPRVINRTGGGATQFNIVGEIVDSITPTLPISFSEITLKLLKSGVDFSSYLVPSEIYPYQTDSTGNFDLTFGVFSTTPPGNYTLRLDFNGTIDLSSYPYSYSFNLPFINTSTVFSYELQINIPATLRFSFWIDGFSSDDPFNPVIDRYDDLNLTAFIQYGGVPIGDDEWVHFYDVTQDNLLIGSDQTINGTAQVSYSTGFTTTAGPHLIYATWNNRYNYSYFILDAPINVTLDICPEPRSVNRSGSVGTDFIIHGYLNDSLNGNPVKYGEISVLLYDGITPVSFYLNLVSGSLQLGASGEIDLTYSVSDSTPTRNYTLQVDYNGVFIYTNPNYPQYFDLWTIANFTDSTPGFYDLKVIDPLDVDIYFFIDGNPTQSFYSNGNPPETYTGIENINFSVYVYQYSSIVNSGTVTFTDIYTGLTLGTPQSVINSFASISVSTLGWHGGLHRIEVQWSGSPAVNSTYVIINKTASIFASINQATLIRNVDSFIVDGTLRENGELLRGLVVNIRLLDDTLTDVSISYLSGSTSIITDALGYYQFDNSIDMSCPQGDYYIRIDFDGDINAPGIYLTNYMEKNSTALTLISIDVLAGNYITGNYETNVVKDDWYYGDDCYVYGYLYWDNGTAMVGMEINVTITDGAGTILATQLGFTDGTGFFNLTFIVGDWPDNTEVWVNFYPEDPSNFGIPDGLYILIIEQEVFRVP